MKKVYVIGCGGIGVSAIARYYNSIGVKVLASDKIQSDITDAISREGIDMIIGEDSSRITSDIELVIYTEAVPDSQSELSKARELNIKNISYPEALSEIANHKKLIAISGTHGKSTTTSLISLVLANSNMGVNAVIGTLLKEFDNKNCIFDNTSDYFVLEACEYKRSFLRYEPYIGVITNIELDHLDYYRDQDDYNNAFLNFIDNIIPGGYAILNGLDKNCDKIKNLRKDIDYIEVFDDYFLFRGVQITFPEIHIQVPGNHILYDAKVAYAVGYIIGIPRESVLSTLSQYTGAWRRTEIVGITINNNLLISDYGHHPTEIFLTLEAISDKYFDKELLVIFQPHQYNRTIELLDLFRSSFARADILIVPNIYESRDSIEDQKKMNTDIFLANINHTNKINGEGFINTSKLIKKYDEKNKGKLVIVLLGAGDVDDLRKKIRYKENIL